MNDDKSRWFTDTRMSAPEMNVMGLMNYILLHLTSLSTCILDMNVIVIFSSIAK